VLILQVLSGHMTFKLKYNFSNQFYNDIIKLIIDLVPSKQNMSKDIYQSKKILASLGMTYEKIDACEKNCMLFQKEPKDDNEYLHCGRSTYVKVVNKDGVSITTKVVTKQLCYMSIMSRLKRSFLFKEIAKQMSHPMDGEAWNALDHFDSKFTRDPRSVRPSLSIDGFRPFSTNSNLYSCWQVFILPYNINPNKCLKQGIIFFTLFILGHKHLENKINMFLCLLFQELKILWQGVMHTTVILNVDSTYVLPICGQSMIIWRMAFLSIVVYMVG
jgi:hypothetical protein